MVAEKHPRLVPASLLDGASCALPRRGEAFLSQLSPAERIVAGQVALGLSNKEIASALGRSQATIKHQLAAAMRRLGVQSRCQLIVLLLRG
jgi:DNA-binding NarL/FixJ family response regulator